MGYDYGNRRVLTTMNDNIGYWWFDGECLHLHSTFICNLSLYNGMYNVRQYEIVHFTLGGI